jgi:signal transduction histidine kinase/CheY-like chemotaxis protein
MKQDEIHTLLNSFFLSNNELDKRSAFDAFAHSLSSIIVDEFATNYLMNNPYLSVYLAHTDGSMLLKKIKSFVAFILTAPVDEEYVKRIHSIGFLHHTIKLEPAKVSYGFWAIGEVLNKLALTNPLVKEHKSFITKLLKFVEHLMNDGYYIKKNALLHDSIGELSSFNAQNELYVGFNIHKLNAKKVQLALADSANIELLDAIQEDHSKCSFGKILQKISDDKRYEYILGTSSDTINDLHQKWHLEFQSIKEALSSKDTDKAQIHNKNIATITQQLLSILDTSIQANIQDGQLSLRSSITSMKKITKIFYNKNYKELQEHSEEEAITKAINETILSEFSWAIEDIKLTDTEPLTNDIKLVSKTIRYRARNIYINIELKKTQNTDYVHEMIQLLLEVLELHFFVQERELSLINFADEAENANKSKDMFLANMSHELRTPINAITGFSQILMKKKDTPESTKKYVEKINIAGNNLLNLVNTILDFAKLESGKMQFNPSLSNIAAILNEVRILVTPLANKKNITLTMPNIVSLNLYMDNTLFKQVLINLLTNAIKFTHQDGLVELHISYNKDNHTYIFEVKDNGIGLLAEDIKKLFTPFSQVENSYQKEHKGSGLGLMISKNIVEELHKGKLWVESIKDKGSSFFIQMPTPMIESHTYSVNNAPQGAAHILVVEDSPEYQKILIDSLQDTHTMTITDTINKAKELISKNHYNFLILDFFLTDGISSEILQFMEEENIFVPAIVISAEDELHISSSLSGSSNLECIINKKDIHQICASIRGEIVNE